MEKHIQKITFRGVLPIKAYNNVLKLLYDNGIPYICFGTISKTRDDAGLLKYFDSILFTHNEYIPYETNRKEISVNELIEKIRNETANI